MPLHFVVFHSVFMALVELSFPIKRQELSNKSRIKEDSKIALRKKRRSDAWIYFFFQARKAQNHEFEFWQTEKAQNQEFKFFASYKRSKT